MRFNKRIISHHRRVYHHDQWNTVLFRSLHHLQGNETRDQIDSEPFSLQCA